MQLAAGQHSAATDAGDDVRVVVAHDGLVQHDVAARLLDLADERGSYSTFEGSLWSRGILPLDSQQILIEQDGNVQILLETEAVSAIAVDGANRKWLGTQSSGAYLVSPDGTEQVLHFTMENSPLPSNNVLSIAIDGVTGEVYMGTDQGIISYRGDAIEGAKDSDCASVFPNPVRETYTGPVAITGLVADSDVRITDIAGNLVYRARSLGGQAIWPATNMSGERVSTGVYLIFASDDTGPVT